VRSWWFAGSAGFIDETPPRAPRRGRLRAALVLCGLTLPLQVLGNDGFRRMHATIGQPLSIQVPLEIAGSRSGSVDVSVEAIAGVPDAERDVAESVIATYDRANSRVLLATPGRVTVPLLRLRLTLVSEALSVTQDVDVLVDLPDFNRNFDRPAAAAADSGGIAANGIKLFESHRHGPEAPLYGDSASSDDEAGPNPEDERPVATPTPVAAQPADPPGIQPERIARKPSPGRELAPARQPQREAVPLAEKAANRTGLASLWFEVLKTRLVSLGLRARSLALLRSSAADNRTREIIAAAAGAPLAALLILMFYRLSQFRAAPARPAIHPAEQRREPRLPGSEAGELARLRRMLDDNPWRSDIRYQFVQRLYKARDAASFAAVALPLKAVATEEIWRRVRAMAEELLPGDARFV
jgi:hypothetical protein